MGNNSVFDDLGLGSSDLGLSQDPDKIAAENAANLASQQAEIDATKAAEETSQAEAADKRRVSSGRSTKTLLTGAAGVDEDTDGASRRKLLGG